MSFELYQRPGKISLVDDDPHFLEVIGMLLPENWAVQLFDQPQKVLQQIEHDLVQLNNEMRTHQRIISRVREGESAMTQMLQYWQEDSGRRFDASSVLIADYAMPAMTGTHLIEQLHQWPGLRVLLTGQADEIVAVTAFNRGLIQQYIPKQTQELAQRLTDAITSNGHRLTHDLSKLWMSTLTREQAALFEDPHIGQWLTQVLAEKGWVEYVVIGAPFGILGLSSNGQPGWLQIEHQGSSRSLADLLETVETINLPLADFQALQEGKLVIDLELQNALRQSGPIHLAPVITPPDTPDVAAAYFPLDSSFNTPNVGCWGHFNKAYSTRKVNE